MMITPLLRLGSRAIVHRRTVRSASIALLALVVATPRLRAELVVNTFVDERDGSVTDGDVSLRDALALAPEGETIKFAGSGVITLKLGQLRITKSLTLDAGPRAGGPSVKIDASGSDPTPATKNGDGSRVFLVDDGNSSITKVVVVRGGFWLRGGDVTGHGGAILSREELTIDGAAIDENACTGSGGAIFSSGPKLSLLGCGISLNAAKLTGGALFLADGYNRCAGGSWGRNVSGGDGGALYNAAKSWVQITTSSFGFNRSTDGRGGAVASVGFLDVIEDSFVGNSAAGDGGAILIWGSKEAYVKNSLFDSNRAAQNGGALCSRNSNPWILNNNLTSNAADGSGGGMFLAGANSRLDANIFARNSAASRGGAVYVNAGVKVAARGDWITSGNYAALTGGGVHVGGGGKLELTGATVAGNVTSSDPTYSGYDLYNDGLLRKNAESTIDKLAGPGKVVNF